MSCDVQLSELEALLNGLVDDFSVVRPIDVRPQRPEELMPNVRSILVHVTALKHTVGRYRPGGWWNNRYLHVRAVNEKVSSFLASEGFRAVCPSPQGHSKRTLMPKLQFKPIALAAGLGWMGRNNLVIHPELGPRIVIGVLLTDALLEAPKKHVLKPLCGDCDLCLHVCPIGALTPDGRYDRFKCYYRNKWLREPCGFLCMRVCPYGAEYEC